MVVNGRGNANLTSRDRHTWLFVEASTTNQCHQITMNSLILFEFLNSDRAQVMGFNYVTASTGINFIVFVKINK
jgi:hypothetical protein